MEILRSLEEELGLEHPYIMAEVCNIAYWYIKSRLWKEAEEVSLRGLPLRTKICSMQNHPDALIAMVNLFRTNVSQHWKEAINHEKQVLELRLQTLGPDL